MSNIEKITYLILLLSSVFYFINGLVVFIHEKTKNRNYMLNPFWVITFKKPDIEVKSNYKWGKLMLGVFFVCTIVLMVIWSNATA